MTGYIYRISCSDTQKAYVGSAKSPSKRWAAHLGLLRKGNHHSVHLQRAFNKHGEAALRFDVVEIVEDDLFLLAREQFWFWRMAGQLYNISPTAGSPLGVKHTDATRAKQADRMRGNAIRRGSAMPLEAKTRISASLAGNENRRGIRHTAEDKAKISASLKRAYEEGRRAKPDPAISAKNLAAWNAKVKRDRAATSQAMGVEP